jgi:hypothetical protein
MIPCRDDQTVFAGYYQGIQQGKQLTSNPIDLEKIS